MKSRNVGPSSPFPPERPSEPKGDLRSNLFRSERVSGTAQPVIEEGGKYFTRREMGLKEEQSVTKKAPNRKLVKEVVQVASQILNEKK